MPGRRLAGIAYLGAAGSTPDALDALEMLLARDKYIAKVRIVTTTTGPVRHHALLCSNEVGDISAIKSGFSSGYGGGGPRWFSFALGLLAWHRVEIDEVECSEELLDRLDHSALGERELRTLLAAPALRPTRFWDYIDDRDYPRDERNPWACRRAAIPWALIDHRLAVLALTFWDDADATLLKGHRQLETLVRARIGITNDEAAALGPSKLYGKAFNGDDAPLYWVGVTSGERAARAGLFTAAVGAYRNVRAHRAGSSCAHEQLRELLILNQLFHLESTALQRLD